MNLLVTLDKNYIKPLSVALASFAKLHKETKTDLYILHSSLEKEDIDVLRSSCGDADIEIHSVFVKEKWFSDTPVLERLPEESFYRLMAFDVLPKTVTKCLYLDPDIIIRKPLCSLYEQNMENYYIFACSHTYGGKDKLNKKRLGIKGHERYINSGIMLMNLEKIRCDFTVEKILEELKDNLQNLLLGDQDLINILFGGNMKVIDERIYNLDERAFRHHKKTFGLDEVREKTAIIHYNGKYKPWLEGYKGKLDIFYPECEVKDAAPKGKLKGQIKSIFNIVGSSKRQKVAIFSVLFGIVFCFVCWLTFGRELIKIVAEPVMFRQWLDNFGAFDEIVFILIRAAQTVVKFIPAEPLEIGSGYAWGAVPGMLYCVIGNMLGTFVILWLTKKFGKAFTDCFLSPKMKKSLEMFSRSDKIYLLLFFLYLIPGSPKDGFTYVVGLLNVKTLPFLIITFIARMPSVLSSTVCGSTLAEQQYLLSFLILVLTGVLAVLGGLLYRSYTKKNAEKEQA